MQFIADLHIHSRYSRATSKDMSPETIWKWAQLKGIRVVGSGDFTHPAWFTELQKKLEPAGNGLFHLRKMYHDDSVPASCASDVSFMLSAEISCIYRKGDKTRKIHCIVFVPDLNSAAEINKVLSGIGKLASDGRPILGLDASGPRIFLFLARCQVLIRSRSVLKN
jgi:PHP family Zn ribbon phosphoesterase